MITWTCMVRCEGKKFEVNQPRNAWIIEQIHASCSRHRVLLTKIERILHQHSQILHRDCESQRSVESFYLSMVQN